VKHGPVPEEPYRIPLGLAQVRREGTDVTVVGIAATVPRALEAAEVVARDGISAEVIDPRTLSPLDVDTIVASVRKTSRAVVLHDAAKRLGYGAEIAAVIQEECFWHLDQPVARVAARNTPTPTSPPLEDAVLPQTPQVVEAVRRLAMA
jgi:2-oxoisovalerate dehydrogenase E1 component beta subunit